MLQKIKEGAREAGGGEERGSSCAHFVCQKLCGEGAKGALIFKARCKARCSCPPFRTRPPLPLPPPPQSPRGFRAGTTCSRPRPSVPASSHLQRAWRQRIRGGREENGRRMGTVRMSINSDIYTRHLHATYKHATGATPPLSPPLSSPRSSPLSSPPSPYSQTVSVAEAPETSLVLLVDLSGRCWRGGGC